MDNCDQCHLECDWTGRYWGCRQTASVSLWGVVLQKPLAKWLRNTEKEHDDPE